VRLARNVVHELPSSAMSPIKVRMVSIVRVSNQIIHLLEVSLSIAHLDRNRPSTRLYTYDQFARDPKRSKADSARVKECMGISIC
jgi:hypothetical protein